MADKHPKSLVDFEVNNRHFMMTACHRLPERSFHYKGRPLLCYRCIGLNGGFFLFLSIQLILMISGFFIELDFHLLTPLLLVSHENMILVFVLILSTQLPFILDGTIQAIFESYESNNYLRFVTGLVGGYGQFALFFFLGLVVRSHLS